MFKVNKIVVRVTSLIQLSPDVIRVVFELPDDHCFRYKPGQYINIILQDGSKRSFSIGCMPNAEGIIELHIRNFSDGGFTEYVFNSLKEQDLLNVEGPFGDFYFRNEENSDSKPIIMLASGTGFTPFKAILESMKEQCIQRRTTLYWGVRRPNDLYLGDWVQSLCKSMANLEYIPVVSEAEPEDSWAGRSGLVHQAVIQDFPDLSAHHVYACVAPIVVDLAERSFTNKCGLPGDQFFS